MQNICYFICIWQVCSLQVYFRQTSRRLSETAIFEHKMRLTPPPRIMKCFALISTAGDARIHKITHGKSQIYITVYTLGKTRDFHNFNNALLLLLYRGHYIAFSLYCRLTWGYTNLNPSLCGEF